MCNLLIAFSMHFYILEDPLVTEHFQSLLLFRGINYLLIDSLSKFKIAFKNSSLFRILIGCTLNSRFFSEHLFMNLSVFKGLANTFQD